MSAPAIPAGYRRLKVGEKIRKGDRLALMGCGPWSTFTCDQMGRIDRGTFPIIRRIAPARKARKEGGKR